MAEPRRGERMILLLPRDE